ncbi:MAG: S8 family serine peptidase [Bacillota bacterium]
MRGQVRRGISLFVVVLLIAGVVYAAAPGQVARAEPTGSGRPARLTQAVGSGETSWPASAPVFADLAGHWAERDVTLLWALGAVEAGAGGLFHPDVPITRAEFTRMLVLALGEAPLTERLPVPFLDVEPERPDAVYISHAAELGLVKGYGDGTFRPDVPITRAEMAAILVRGLGDRQPGRVGSTGSGGTGLAPAAGAGAGGTGGAGLPDFRDAATIPWWATAYVAEGVRRGLVEGYEDQTFRPAALTSRAEAAAFIVRTLHARATAFDFFGVLARSEAGALDVSLAGAGGLDKGAVRLRLAPGVQVFRNGARVGLASLLPGDEVGLILDERGLVSFVDAHLVTVWGTLQAVRRAGEAYFLSLHGEGVPLPVLPGAPVFRNGRAAAMGELQPGDQVYALRQWTSGWVRALLAVRIDLSGELTAREETAVVVIPRQAQPPPGESGVGEPRRVEVFPRAAIFLDGRIASLDDLRPGDEVGLARDGKGRVVYLEAWRNVRDEFKASRSGGPPGTVTEVAQADRTAVRAVKVAQSGRAEPATVGVPRLGRPVGPMADGKEEARVSLDLTAKGQEAIRLGEFLAQFPAGQRPDGRGITIAIIDTGIDPAHPDLQSCPDGAPKLVDWVDFSGEGRVEIADEARGTGDRLTTPLGVFRLGAVRSVGGVYRWGFFREGGLEADAPHEQDLNRNGNGGDVFPVFALDTVVAGQYDTVVVDTDRDQDLGDEVPLVPLRVTASRGELPRVAWFGPRDRGVPFVLADLDPGGRWVSLGFDGHGHGTHVAGTAAAWNPGGLKGAAPGARLMALKALRSSGDGSWSTIAQAMVYAAEHGAQVVGISAGGKGDSSWEGSPESELMAQLADRYGVTFVVAAGNDGPGLGTSSPPGDGRTTLITGAYMSPAMWEKEFGYRVPEEGLWDFSGVGPRVDGTLAPEVVAPGSATSCVPRWLVPGGYQPMDGTSVAVPYLAGMLALLRQAADAAGYQVDAAGWRQAVMAGARPLPRYTLVEQGYGLVDAVGTWRELQRLAGPGSPAVRVSAYLDPGVCLRPDVPGYAEVESGVYARQMRPGRVEATAVNEGEHAVALDLVSDADWVWPTRQRLFLHPLEGRSFGVEYRIPGSPGLYTAQLRGRDGSRDRFAFLSTLVVPEYLGLDEEGNPAPLRRYQSGSLAPARWQRYFFRIPAGAASLRLTVAVPRGDWGYRGRVRLHVYRPDGGRQAVTGYVGAGASGAQARIEVPFPQPGVWEVVVQSAPSLSYYGLDRSLYSLEVDLQAVLVTPAELRVWVPPGPETEVRVPVQAVNEYDFFTGCLRGMGLARAGAATEERQTTTLTATRSEPAVFQLPIVPDDAVEMWLQLCDVVPSGADLNLYLYRRNPASGEWEEMARSTWPGLGEERITLSFPPPGEYVAYVEVEGTADPVNARLCYGFLTDQGQVTVEDEPAGRELGRQWSATLVLRVPAQEGFYAGRLVVYDTVAGRSLGGVPVIVQRGYPQVIAQVVPGLIPSTGGRVALHVREAAEMGKVELRALVNGRVYQVTDGEVLVPVFPEGEMVPLDIRLESCSYALWEGRTVIPVAAPGYRMTAEPSRGGVLWDRHHLILQELLSGGSEGE